MVRLIEAEGRKAVALPGGIREEAVCEKLVADAVEGLGGLDVLVNNAATQRYRPSILDLSTAELDSIFKTNVYALYWITKAAIPHLGPGASIVNSTSRQAHDPSPEHLVYAPTKAAELGTETSLGRVGQPAEIAAPYVHLASHESSYSTGQVMGASGGGGML